MTEYIMLFRGGDPAESALSPDELQAYFQRWNDWVESLKAKGIFTNGAPLGREGKVIQPGDIVTDGPFAESKEVLGGFITISVATREEALSHARGCPLTELGGTVEVRAIAEECPAEAAAKRRQEAGVAG